MKKTLFLLSAALLATIIQTASAADNPQPIHAGTRILQSGNMVVEVGDPDSPDCRWNQGLRFSPVGNIIQVTLNGLEFCYAPVTGGSLTYLGGLPMEFDIGQESFQPDPPGYNDGTNGSPFLKIGVGILTRNSSAYNFSSNYPIVELAQTTTTWQRDRAHFDQTLSGTADGYSCRLEQDVIVKNDTIIINYVLTNTGTKEFTTEQYLHNFLTFSNTNVGPDYRVYFPYDVEASPQPQLWEPPIFGQIGRTPGFIDSNPPMVSLENMVLYTKTISSVPKTWIYKPDDYLGPDTVAVEQSDIGQRVIIDSSLRSAYIGIWTTSYQVSPEQFVFITLAPGQHVEFTRTYKFSTDGSVRQDCTGDGIINGNDLFALSSAWLSEPDQINWDSSCDMSNPVDDFINFNDFTELAQVWNQDTNDPAPVASWSMDETAGMVAADSIGSYDGSLVGFSEDNSQWVTGHLGGGLEFDGMDDYVEVEGFTGVCSTKPRAVVAWIKTDGVPANNLPIITWGQKQPRGYWLIEVDEDQRLRLSCESGFISANQQQVGDGTWHHIAVVLDPVDSVRPLISDVLLYIDGQRRTIYKMQEAQINTGCIENVRIGAAHDTDSNTFTGIIDEVTIFDIAVSPTAIRTLTSK
ncbi:MAG: LamG domain-containing protein [Planctomycetes bacterium]|nr:LamG domain-containing protein [Planctomycetota bacterium]